jgi:predicted secreted acid phosphatase
MNTSAYNALLVHDRKPFDADTYKWNDFVLAEQSTEVTGVAEFAREAKKAGVSRRLNACCSDAPLTNR